ncbi:MAG: hypothetical protein J2P26_15365, partial [Nocardiopsaceae bacterium]|nr:hypothetical protein [Nocardiopsaceae bacterium]
AAPVAGYASWYDVEHGSFNISTANGVFLYSRVMTFADCSKMGKLPINLLSLCTTLPPDERPIAQSYIWNQLTPLDRFPSPKFSALPNNLAQEFAVRAIEAQPGAYATAVFDDTWRAFYWSRTVFPNAQTYNEYLFGYHSVPISRRHPIKGYPSSADAYVAGGDPVTKIVNPYAGAIRVYQRYLYLPGTVYGLILLFGLGALVLGWRHRQRHRQRGRQMPGGNAGLAALLPWATSFGLIVVPAATAEFDYRYVTTAVPFGCMALAVAYAAGRSRLTRKGEPGPDKTGPEETGPEEAVDGQPGAREKLVLAPVLADRAATANGANGASGNGASGNGDGASADSVPADSVHAGSATASDGASARADGVPAGGDGVSAASDGVPAGDGSAAAASPSGEAGGPPRLTSSLTSGRPGDGPADPGHDQRDLTPDAP